MFNLAAECSSGPRKINDLAGRDDRYLIVPTERTTDFWPLGPSKWPFDYAFVSIRQCDASLSGQFILPSKGLQFKRV
jgi:hypothetical protein